MNSLKLNAKGKATVAKCYLNELLEMQQNAESHSIFLDSIYRVEVNPNITAFELGFLSNACKRVMIWIKICENNVDFWVTEKSRHFTISFNAIAKTLKLDRKTSAKIKRAAQAKLQMPANA